MTPKMLQNQIGKYLLNNDIELVQEIFDVFDKFTRQHITRVNTLASFLNKYYPSHDADKFSYPFYYLLQYTSQGGAVGSKKPLESVVKTPKLVNELINAETWRHVRTNPHHPEYHDPNQSIDNPFDRSNPNKGIDATLMSDEYLEEYVCDCLSMSIMLQKNPNAVFHWFDTNVDTGGDKRWKMTPRQIDFIYRTADKIVLALRDKNRKVYFDVDGVLRDMTSYFGLSDDLWDQKKDGQSVYDLITSDFSSLEKMKPLPYLKTVKAFTRVPNIMTRQIEPESQYFTGQWLLKYFDKFRVIYVEDKNTKINYLRDNDRLFDDHPNFLRTNKLITVGHGYNKNRPTFRVESPAEMEAALEVLRNW
jgi:hypothetical protein